MKHIMAVLAVVTLGALGACTRSEEPKSPAPAAKKAAPAAAAPEQAPEEEVEEALLVWAEAEPEDGKAPLKVKFTADISGGAKSRTVTWDFGDGTKSHEENPTHTYDKPGTYRATIEVEDSTGDSDSDYVEIEVE